MEMTFAYADPPYLGNGKKRYSQHENASEYDSKQSHINLVNWLNANFDGWALSCNPSDLHWLLPHCPNDTRIACWVKPFHQIRRTTVQYAWEAVLFRGSRINNMRKPMVRDWISHVPTRKKGTVGAKPEAFNKWVLELLNYQAGDTFCDVFPGSGGMSAIINS